MKKHLLTAAVAIASIATIAAFAPQQHIGPTTLYPNPSNTPGLIATQDFTELTSNTSCGTYSACHRHTSEFQKKQVRAEYSSCPQDAEIDHFVPLALGGADDVKNLWCQPAINMWKGTNFGFHEKDKLESYLVLQMKAGNISPKDAQVCLLTDWVKCFQKYIKPTFGAVNSTVDPDEL